MASRRPSRRRASHPGGKVTDEATGTYVAFWDSQPRNVPHVDARQSDRLLREAIQACIDAYATSKETIAYCLEAGEPLVEGQLIVTLLCCADACRTNAEFVMVEADLGSESCSFCARVCERTAERCRQMPDDEQLELCADALRRCATACTAVAEGDLSDEHGRLAVR